MSPASAAVNAVDNGSDRGKALPEHHYRPDINGVVLTPSGRIRGGYGSLRPKKS
jgi:hypothetical protein